MKYRSTSRSGVSFRKLKDLANVIRADQKILVKGSILGLSKFLALVETGELG